MGKATELLRAGFLLKKDVIELLPVSRKQLDKWIKDGEYPPPIRISVRIIVFSSYEVFEFHEAIRASESKEGLRLLVKLLVDDRR